MHHARIDNAKNVSRLIFRDVRKGNVARKGWRILNGRGIVRMLHGETRPERLGRGVVLHFKVAYMISFKNQSLLVVAPHPDDEVFGCGGLIYRVKREGGSVHVLFLTVGTTKDFSKKGASSLDERLKEIDRVVKFLQIDSYHVAFPGNEYHLQLDHVPQKELINEIERGTVSLESLKPTILAFPSSFDYNQDHRAANEACISATRPVNGTFKHIPRLLLEYEFPYAGWSPLQGSAPNFFVSLDKPALNAKLKALKLYKSQMKVQKGPISVYGAESLARARGIIASADHAEAFVLRRTLV